ncbi:MAG: alginate lyase family protein [Acidobacteria bacterium]|uniref:Alginate lyase family protein n=1 Tax=Candidatus Polarisedimenticola svalbardensis TaxID=2886004 RepID=A0A8J6XUL8_9BACT|nr:alginate lyase family protein [Candidatus Polarisedimenticola svalbardensis]
MDHLLDKLPLYFHSVRYLKPIQVYGRVRNRMRKVRPDLSPAPSLRKQAGMWTAGVRRPARMSGPERFRFLNQTRNMPAASDWNRADVEKLWLYNLHYFDDLNAEGGDDRRAWHTALIERWIHENRPGPGNGWEPYPVSLRIVNWIRYFLEGNAAQQSWVDSLAVQARWLKRQVEWHLLGNHLMANAKALVFAGVYFEGSEAESWRAEGVRILDAQFGEQILDDGGHFELSPMYHAIILEDILDLQNLARAYPGALPTGFVDRLASLAGPMLSWLEAMTHPDGEIALLNDSAFGISGTPAEIAGYGERLGFDKAPKESAVDFRESSGYIRLMCGEMVAFLDVGRIGPDYLPGHSHADSLTFEMSLFGERVIVDSGTSCYGTGEERLRQRGTAAHNTVEIDAADSSEVWSGFRVARRAHPGPVSCREDDSGCVEVNGSHDGYRRLEGKPVHRRAFRSVPERFTVTDHIEGEFRQARAMFHLHPNVRAACLEEGGGAVLSLAGDREIRITVAGGECRLVETTWHPEFGVSLPSTGLLVRLTGPELVTDFSWR